MPIDKNPYSPQKQGSIADELTSEFHSSIKRLGRAIEITPAFYVRPSSTDQYLRPDGTSIYFRF